MPTAAVASWEYKNDFFSIAVRESGSRPGSYVFSSGLSLPRFDPICWGRTGICSNAAFKGLQQLRADVSHFALQRGIVTRGSDAPTTAERGRGTGWYQENDLVIEDASTEFIEELIEFSSRDLVHTILTACSSGVRVPDGHVDAEAMQRFLETLRVPNYKNAAPPPIAKAKAA